MKERSPSAPKYFSMKITRLVVCNSTRTFIYFYCRSLIFVLLKGLLKHITTGPSWTNPHVHTTGHCSGVSNCTLKSRPQSPHSPLSLHSCPFLVWQPSFKIIVFASDDRFPSHPQCARSNPSDDQPHITHLPGAAPVSSFTYSLVLLECILQYTKLICDDLTAWNILKHTDSSSLLIGTLGSVITFPRNLSFLPDPLECDLKALGGPRTPESPEQVVRS